MVIGRLANGSRRVMIIGELTGLDDPTIALGAICLGSNRCGAGADPPDAHGHPAADQDSGHIAVSRRPATALENESGVPAGDRRQA